MKTIEERKKEVVTSLEGAVKEITKGQDHVKKWKTIRAALEGQMLLLQEMEKEQTEEPAAVAPNGKDNVQ